jgi:hypothetical protein
MVKWWVGDCRGGCREQKEGSAGRRKRTRQWRRKGGKGGGEEEEKKCVRREKMRLAVQGALGNTLGGGWGASVSIFFASKSKTSENSIFLLQFEDSKKSQRSIGH